MSKLTNLDDVRTTLKARLKQLENDRTLSSFSRKSRMAEVNRMLKLIGEDTDKYSDFLRNN